MGLQTGSTELSPLSQAASLVFGEINTFHYLIIKIFITVVVERVLANLEIVNNY